MNGFWSEDYPKRQWATRLSSYNLQGKSVVIIVREEIRCVLNGSATFRVIRWALTATFATMWQRDNVVRLKSCCSVAMSTVFGSQATFFATITKSEIWDYRNYSIATDKTKQNQNIFKLYLYHEFDFYLHLIFLLRCA